MQTAHVVNQYQVDNPKLVIHDTEAPTFEGRLAIVLVEKWGMVAGVDDGEDKAGRSKLRLMAPDEVVKRACTTSALLAAALREKGWMTALPAWGDMEQIVKDAKAKSLSAEETDRVKRAADRAERSGK